MANLINQDIDGYLALCGAIIWQAVVDGAKHPSTKEGKDGYNFIATRRLEKFLTTWDLPIYSYYIRKKFKYFCKHPVLIRSVEQNKYKYIKKEK